MIKTIKVKKTKDLSELIAYISVSGIKDANFVSNYENIVSVDYSGQIITVGKFYNDTFTVEVEEEFDYDTVLEKVYRVTQEGEVTSDNNKSINDCLDWKDYQVQIFAMLDGKLQLIWEAE